MDIIKIWLADNKGRQIKTENALSTTIDLLKKGNIVAIKGLGGFHLACDPFNREAVIRLRKRKKRLDKPFALMIKNKKVVKKYCLVNKLEEEVLNGSIKPIVLLKKKEGLLFEVIAPGSQYLGVMLPYTPLHEQLFTDDLDMLIMTSGNISSFSIEYINKGALERLSKVADYYLLHDKKIEIPIDDSVVRIVMGKIRVIRIGRGYAPMVLKSLFNKESILACGANTGCTFALAGKEYVVISQHMGDIINLENYQNYYKVVRYFKRFYQLDPNFVAHDLHPGYLTTDFASKQQGVKKSIQHHHAHIVSCMFENNLEDKVIGLAFDGTGLGNDGQIWGGEFLICDYREYKRVGHLNYVLLPGGEIAVKEPWRMAVSYLYHTFKDNKGPYNNSYLEEYLPDHLKDEKYHLVLNMLKTRFNCQQTSSMGRFFAAVSAILSIRKRITYEGQAAIELESAADKKERGSYEYKIINNKDIYVIDTKPIIKDILFDFKKGGSIEMISGRFHNTIINLSVELCRLIRDKFQLNKVVLSGGVFQNEILCTGIFYKLQEEGFTVYTHSRVPCNDEGLSLGQLIIGRTSQLQGVDF